SEIVDLVLQTGPVAKTVLVLLIAFSVLSWAVILSKWRLIRRARGQSERFVRVFRKAQRIQDVAPVAEQFRPSPLVGVFAGAVAEFKRQMGMTGGIHNLVATQRAVAPGISEALITTAAGLAAAIPAVIAYNLIIGSIREMASRNDDFTLEMLNLVERQTPAADRQPPPHVTEARR